MMRQLITDFPSQIEAAWANANECRFMHDSFDAANVVITGLGGSGIGGKIISQLYQDEAKVPMVVNNDYTLPGFVSPSTLVIVSSYSGNTEETIAAMEQALAKGATVACITSGGKAESLALTHNLDVIKVPGGQPPRSQFGYSAISLVKLLCVYGIISSDRFNELETLGAFLRNNQEDTIHRAEGLVKFLEDRIPIIYSEVKNEGVAIRWRQQLNENSKKLCWHHFYPEMNHNELVGWEGGDDRFAVLMMRSQDDHPRSNIRMNITEPMYLSKGAKVENIVALGDSRAERVFDLIHLGDWLSLLLAETNHIDPVIITSIDLLKSALSKVE